MIGTFGRPGAGARTGRRVQAVDPMLAVEAGAGPGVAGGGALDFRVLGWRGRVKKRGPRGLGEAVPRCVWLLHGGGRQLGAAFSDGGGG